jgi:molecular chaperone GrpE
MDKRETHEAAASRFNVVDKRKFVNTDVVDVNSIEEEKPRYPSYVEELMAKVKETERQFQEKKKQIDEEIGRVRARLETDFEQRVEEERCRLALPFLEVLDNLERAVEASMKNTSVEHLREGVEMTAHLFRTKLRAIGVEAVTSMSRPFDPNVAQAVGMVPVSDAAEDGMVVEELQIGYTIGNRLLRPAHVRVGRASV